MPPWHDTHAAPHAASRIGNVAVMRFACAGRSNAHADLFLKNCAANFLANVNI